MIKYAICTGYIISKSDGDMHWLDASQLIKLYGIRREECIIIEEGDKNSERGYTSEFLDSLTYLRPRYNGDYLIPRL